MAEYFPLLKSLLSTCVAPGTVRRGPVCAHNCMIGESWAWLHLCKDEWQDSWCHGVPELVKYTRNSAGDTRDAGSILGQEDPWRWKWQPTLGLLPGESHEQRSLAGYSPWGPKESDLPKRLNSSNNDWIQWGLWVDNAKCERCVIWLYW